MEQFLKLLATLIIEESNFRVLHWNAAGELFDRIHSLALGGHDMTSGHVDDVAEIMMMLGGTPLNYTEALAVATKCSVGIANTEEYDFEEYLSTSSQMYEAILQSIEEVLSTDVCGDPKNVGIKATIEAMHMEYDKQLRYLTTRRAK